MTDPSGTLGYLVWEKRERDGLSVRGAAKEIGCNAMILSRVESGLPPSLQNLARIVIWLEAKPAKILEAIKEFA